MSYPMMGDGNNEYSRVKADWEHLRHYLTILSGEALPTEMLQRSKAQGITTTISLTWEVVFNQPRKGLNPHMLPHGGRIWGKAFEVKTYRLCRKSRNQRFIARKGAK